MSTRGHRNAMGGGGEQCIAAERTSRLFQNVLDIVGQSKQDTFHIELKMLYNVVWYGNIFEPHWTKSPNFLFSSSDDALFPAHVNQPFSTYDRDNDADNAANCADRLKGGWWFKTCTAGSGDPMQSKLNGEYSYPVINSGQDYRGMRWGELQGKEIRGSRMALRRVR